MPKPLAICIEDLDSQPRTSKYLRCVALPGRQPGLRLDKAGQVLWQSDDAVSCELWVSADERLILYRPAGATRVTLHRARRSLDVPYDKPVVIIDKDQIDVGSRRLRIHVHGEAPAVAAPSPLPSRPHSLGRLAQAAAAAAVMGAVTAAGGCSDTDAATPTPTIEVRVDPPEIVIPMTPEPTPTIEIRVDPPVIAATPEPTPAMSTEQRPIEEIIQGEWIVTQAYDVANERVLITGTLTIEENSYTFEPTQKVEGPSVQGNLDFLFDTPRGEVTIDYTTGVTPSNTLQDFASGDILATCTFHADATTTFFFLIIVGDSNDLSFQRPSGEINLWSVTKQLRTDTEK